MWSDWKFSLERKGELWTATAEYKDGLCYSKSDVTPFTAQAKVLKYVQGIEGNPPEMCIAFDVKED